MEPASKTCSSVSYSSNDMRLSYEPTTSCFSAKILRGNQWITIPIEADFAERPCLDPAKFFATLDSSYSHQVSLIKGVEKLIFQKLPEAKLQALKATMSKTDTFLDTAAPLNRANQTRIDSFLQHPREKVLVITQEEGNHLEVAESVTKYIFGKCQSSSNYLPALVDLPKLTQPLKVTETQQKYGSEGSEVIGQRDFQTVFVVNGFDKTSRKFNFQDEYGKENLNFKSILVVPKSFTVPKLFTHLCTPHPSNVIQPKEMAIYPWSKASDQSERTSSVSKGAGSLKGQEATSSSLLDRAVEVGLALAGIKGAGSLKIHEEAHPVRPRTSSKAAAGSMGAASLKLPAHPEASVLTAILQRPADASVRGGADSLKLRAEKSDEPMSKGAGSIKKSAANSLKLPPLPEDKVVTNSAETPFEGINGAGSTRLTRKRHSDDLGVIATPPTRGKTPKLPEDDAGDVWV